MASNIGGIAAIVCVSAGDRKTLQALLQNIHRLLDHAGNILWKFPSDTVDNFVDAFDRRILECLQRDASQTNQALADEVGLSPSACLARVKRLKDSGVVDKVVAILNPEAVATCMYMVIEVTMERDDKMLYQRFESSVLAAPDVKQCYQVTGECDFVLIITVPDMDAYDRFCDTVLYADDNMRKFRTLISRKRTKFDLTASLPRE